MMVSNAAIDKIRNTANRYPDRRAALIPALHIIQEEAGFISPEAIKCIAAELNVTESDVYGTASFYSLFRWKKPGRNVIYVCHNLSCSLMGAESVLDYLGKKLGVKEGEATPDGRFSFERIECIGRCDKAPAMMVNDDYHDDLTPEKIDSILEKYK